MLTIILVIIGVAIIYYGRALTLAVIAHRVRPNLEALILGAVVNFFDALGIGSFATTTAWMKFRRLVPDRLIPPTMIAGLTPPVLAESVIFLILLGVLVDPILLFGCAMATMAGGLVGAPLVARARVWVVQLLVAIGLILAATAYGMTNLHLFPVGGTSTGLPPVQTSIAIIVSFGLGLLANFGVGNFAPTLVILSLMGMDPRLCFPIMATGGSLMGVGSGVRHIRMGQIDLRIVLGLALGGIPAVIVAALIVKSMPLELLRWMVLVVVVYAAIVLLRAALSGRRDEKAQLAQTAVVAS
ncbi:sulfite exporter TauE/SafE family protein [Sphingomonas sp. RB56-2]|uniref:Probable membrane transporter protein n=1 Tax=Sphingomonas brevis TaxID=2908206 RepID=A0ABT0SAR9_9SPHN|nr:sulfite exporter TauE/SafE family protein [Sphingomonas brevis]MCL6741443.1 sulfite exporter TauE/SafE family protein [Sphingomonas brevis]